MPHVRVNTRTYTLRTCYKDRCLGGAGLASLMTDNNNWRIGVDKIEMLPNDVFKLCVIRYSDEF